MGFAMRTQKILPISDKLLKEINEAVKHMGSSKEESVDKLDDKLNNKLTTPSSGYKCMLSGEDVDFIRCLIKMKFEIWVIAKYFNLPRSTISGIKKGVMYAHHLSLFELEKDSGTITPLKVNKALLEHYKRENKDRLRLFCSYYYQSVSRVDDGVKINVPENPIRYLFEE